MKKVLQKITCFGLSGLLLISCNTTGVKSGSVKGDREIASTNNNLDKFEEALGHCLNPSVNLQNKLNYYIYLTNYAHGRYINECEDEIVKIIFPETFDQDEYLGKLFYINEVAKQHPSNMCQLDMAIRAHWERLFLPLLETEYFKEFRPISATSNIYKTMMAILVFKGRGKQAGRLAKIARFSLQLAAFSYVDEQFSENKDAILLKRNRFSNAEIPVDPALALDCPAIGSLDEGIKMASLHELGMKLDMEVIAQLQSMSINIGTFYAMKLLKHARVAKRVTFGLDVARSTRGVLGIAAVAGPQAIVFLGSLAAYEGVTAAITAHINNKRRSNLENQLLSSINELDATVTSMTSTLAKLPDNFYSLPPDRLDAMKDKIGLLSQDLNSSYILSRKVMENVYNLIGFYNVPILEQTMRLKAELDSIQDIKTQSDKSVKRELSWIETAYENIQNDLENSNNRSYAEFQAQTNSNNIPPEEVTRAYNQWQAAVREFDTNVSFLKLERKTCVPQSKRDDTYLHSIYRHSLTRLLKDQNSDSFDSIQDSLAEAATIPAQNNTMLAAFDRNVITSEDVLNSIYDDIETYMRNTGTSQRLSSRYLNHLRLTYLERANRKSEKRWHDMFKKGEFCKSPNSILHQTSDYFAYLDRRINSLYKNKMRIGFFRSFSERLGSEISRNNALESEVIGNIKVHILEQPLRSRRNSRFGGAM